MIKVRFEELVINSLIILKEKYNISKVTSVELENYKKAIFKNLKTEEKIINITEEKELDKEYSKYINVREIYNDFYEYSIKPTISLEKLKEKFYDKLSKKYKEAYTNDAAISYLTKSIKDKKGSVTTSKTYEKLVRDNVPGILVKNGEKPSVQILNDRAYKEQLYKKLSYAYLEFMKAFEVDEKIELGTDLVELLSSIIKLDTKEDILLKEVSKKKKKQGGYDKMLYLEKIESNLKVEER